MHIWLGILSYSLTGWVEWHVAVLTSSAAILENLLLGVGVYTSTCGTLHSPEREFDGNDFTLPAMLEREPFYEISER